MRSLLLQAAAVAARGHAQLLAEDADEVAGVGEAAGARHRAHRQARPAQQLRRPRDAARVQVLDEALSGAAPAETGTADLVSAKRLITTIVMVGDGEFLILGGLIDETFSAQDSRVPILGDIPLLGHLFRSRSRGNQQSVLMVFIRPTVLDTVDDRKNATGNRYRYLRQRQLNFSEGYEDEGMRPLPESIDQLNEPDETRPGDTDGE